MLTFYLFSRVGNRYLSSHVLSGSPQKRASYFIVGNIIILILKVWKYHLTIIIALPHWDYDSDRKSF